MILVRRTSAAVYSPLFPSGANMNLICPVCGDKVIFGVYPPFKCPNCDAKMPAVDDLMRSLIVKVSHHLYGNIHSWTKRAAEKDLELQRREKGAQYYE